MPTRIQFRRGTTSQHSSFTGAVGEITVDTDKEVAVVHDGATAGGYELARGDVNNVSNPQFSGTSSLLMPVGTTAQRPASPSNGQIRYNSSTSKIEGYQNSSWQNLGGVVQVKNTLVTSTAVYSTSTNDALFPITALNVSITPSNSSNKIIIFVRIEGETGFSPWDGGFVVYNSQSASYVNRAPSAGSRIRFAAGISTAYGAAGDNGSTPDFRTFFCVDSPNTTSAITYTVYCGSSVAAGSYYLNRTVADNDSVDSYERFSSEIIAMEYQP